MNFSICPRCECESYETLETYDYCANCNFSHALEDRDFEPAIPEWVKTALGDDFELSELQSSIDQSIGGFYGLIN